MNEPKKLIFAYNNDRKVIVREELCKMKGFVFCLQTGK